MRFAFNKKLTVYRLVSDSENKKESYNQIGEIEGAVMSIKAEDTLLSEGNPAEMLKLYTDINSDIRESDKVLCDGQKYIVKNIRKPDLGGLSRIQAIIIKTNN